MKATFTLISLVVMWAVPAFGQESDSRAAMYGKAIYLGRATAFEQGRRNQAAQTYGSEAHRPILDDVRTALDAARGIADPAERRAAILAIVSDERDVPFDLRREAFAALALQPADDAAAIRQAVEGGLARSRVVDAEKLLEVYLPALAALDVEIDAVIRDGDRPAELRWLLWEHRARQLAVEHSGDFAGFAEAAKSLGEGIEFSRSGPGGVGKFDAGSDLALVPYLHLIAVAQREAVFAFVEALPLAQVERFTLQLRWLLAHGERQEALAFWNASEAAADAADMPESLRNFLFIRKWEIFGHASMDAAYLERSRILQTNQTGNLGYGKAYLASDDVLRILSESPQALLNSLRRNLQRQHGRVTAEQLQALADRLIDGRGEMPLAVSQGAKDFAAKLEPNTYPWFMYRGEFDEAARFAWGKLREAQGETEYSRWAKRTAEAVMCREQCYNGTARDFLLWLNGELKDDRGIPVDGNPIRVILEED